MGRRVKDDDITKGRKMRSLVAVILACLGCLVLAVSGRADAPKADAPKADAPKADAPKADALQMNAAQRPEQVFTYYLHRVKIEETSPAEYLWVISNDQPDSVAAKSLGSQKLRDWVRHRQGYTLIIWPHPYDFGVLSGVLGEALKAIAKRNPDGLRNGARSTDADIDKTPDEGVAEFKKFCESNHVEFCRTRSQF